MCQSLRGLGPHVSLVWRGQKKTKKLPRKHWNVFFSLLSEAARKEFFFFCIFGRRTVVRICARRSGPQRWLRSKHSYESFRIFVSDTLLIPDRHNLFFISAFPHGEQKVSYIQHPRVPAVIFDQIITDLDGEWQTEESESCLICLKVVLVWWTAYIFEALLERWKRLPQRTKQFHFTTCELSILKTWMVSTSSTCSQVFSKWHVPPYSIFENTFINTWLFLWKEKSK